MAHRSRAVLVGHAFGLQPGATLLPSKPVAPRNPATGPGRAAGTRGQEVAVAVDRGSRATAADRPEAGTTNSVIE
jgi:hypothetical protein